MDGVQGASRPARLAGARAPPNGVLPTRMNSRGPAGPVKAKHKKAPTTSGGRPGPKTLGPGPTPPSLVRHHRSHMLATLPTDRSKFTFEMGNVMA